MTDLGEAFVETSEDLASLTKLDENVMVKQLHSRYDNDDIYVRIFLLLPTSHLSHTHPFLLLSV